MIILLLLRRLSPRGRRITGAALAANLYIHGALLMALGAFCYLRADAVGRRSRPSAQ